PAQVPAKFSLGYRPSLDGFRAVAIIAVMGFHDGVSFAAGGSLGVDMFFVLSGFLITSLLIEEWAKNDSISLTRFYARRALRLLPALVVMLACYEIYALVRLHGAELRATELHILAALLYSANWVRALAGPNAMGDAIPHTWSLAVEEQFYFLWPP